jgi:hypothetical protein
MEYTQTTDSFSERVAKYLKLSHQTLAEMLAMRDEEDDNRKHPNMPEYPLQPNQPFNIQQTGPYTINNYRFCPLSTGGICTNPQFDCINCPYYSIGVTTSFSSTREGIADSNSKTGKDKTKLND